MKLRDSGLELKRVPVATQRIGLAAIPNVDDLVLVAFVGGDLQRPVIVGRLYNDVDRRAGGQGRANASMCRPTTRSRACAARYFELPERQQATLDDDKFVLDMGATKLTIKNGGDIELASAADVNDQGGGRHRRSRPAASSSSRRSSSPSATSAKLQGLSVSVKAQTSAQVEGQAQRHGQGTVVTLAGNASFSPSQPDARAARNSFGCAVIVSPGAAGPPDSGFIVADPADLRSPSAECRSP